MQHAIASTDYSQAFQQASICEGVHELTESPGDELRGCEGGPQASDDDASGGNGLLGKLQREFLLLSVPGYQALCRAQALPGGGSPLWW